MKIAVCYNLSFGGAKRAMFELVKRLVKQHSVDFYRLNAAEGDGRDIDPLVKQVVMVPGPALAGGFRMLTALPPLRAAYAEIARRINGGRYDVALVSQCRISHTPYLLRYLTVPSVYYCQEPGNRHLEPQARFEGRLGFIKKAAVYWRFRRVDCVNARCATVICANSRYSAEAIYRAYGVVPRHCPLGVDADCFRPLASPRAREVLVVGSLTRSKAPEFVIDSIGTLSDRPVIRFIYNFGQTTASQRWLAERAKQSGVTVHFENLVSDENLVGAYNRAALVAVASVLEPMGFVPLEAMACATPVVAVAEAGLREAIQDGVTGLLTDRDPVEFGQAVDRLLKDAALGRRLGAAGRQYVLEHRTWDQAYAYLEQNIQRALAQRRD